MRAATAAAREVSRPVILQMHTETTTSGVMGTSRRLVLM
jgi:hypothetical protein